MTTSFTRSPAGDQLWNSGRQNWIFGRIGDQEGAISDPVFEGLTNVILLVKTSDMASLLREQTRIKESLEGALERQKEGMHTIYQEIMNLGNTLGEEGLFRQCDFVRI